MRALTLARWGLRIHLADELGLGIRVALVLATASRRSQHVDENDHPKGALLFMLVYLALLAFMWTNLYLKLWTR